MINPKAAGITIGIVWALWVGWAILIAIFGMGNTPFNFFSELYFGWIKPDIGGLILGIVLAFLDGLICGLIFGWLYNKIAGKKAGSCCS